MTSYGTHRVTLKQRVICFFIGHNAKGQRISYHGVRYQYRCRRCQKLITEYWS